MIQDSTSSWRNCFVGRPLIEGIDSGSNRSPSEIQSGTLALPSEIITVTTLPTSFLILHSFIPTLAAVTIAWASGDPPPHGIDSSLALVSAVDLVGGTKTSAELPWKTIRLILSRALYASDSNAIAAPFAASILLRAYNLKSVHYQLFQYRDFFQLR